MKPGTYQTLDDVEAVSREWWLERAYRFGEWEFRPAVGEVWYLGDVIQLTVRETDTLRRVIDAWPEWVPKLDKQFAMRVRRKIGPSLIESSRMGYRFCPREVLAR